MTLPDMDSLDTYGGARVSRWLAFDPRTERTAEEITQAYSILAAATKFAVRCWAKFSITSGGDATIDDWAAVWAGDAPTIEKRSTGLYRITWPTTVTDELGVQRAVRLRQVWTNTDYTTDIGQAVMLSRNLVALAGVTVGGTYEVFCL